MGMDIGRIVKALVIDDEPAAGKNLQHLLSLHSIPIHVIGIARNTTEARRILSGNKPDIVFLDIEMPGENGIQFLESLALPNFEVIFVTAYNEHAIKAFKLNAIDYILKPINKKNLDAAINKAYERVAIKSIMAANPLIFSDLNKQLVSPRLQDRLVIKNAENIEIIPFKKIIYIEGNGSYSYIHFFENQAERMVVASYPIADYERTLPEDAFFRIHKSYLLNQIYVCKVIKGDNAKVSLSSGIELPISRRRCQNFIDFLAKHH